MPRVKKTVPTKIYFLIDNETCEPFYCGKTIHGEGRRITGHLRTVRTHPDRAISRKIAEIGENFTMVTVETVPVGEDWEAREMFWIASLRFAFPDCVNSADGGHGCTGYVMSPAAVAKSRMAKIGKARSVATREKLSNALKGRNIAANSPHKQKGRPNKPGHLEALRLGREGRIWTSEARSNASLAKIGHEVSDETRAKISAANQGRKWTPEHRAKVAATKSKNKELRAKSKS